LASLDAGSWFILFAIADIPTTQNDFLRDDYVATSQGVFRNNPPPAPPQKEDDTGKAPFHPFVIPNLFRELSFTDSLSGTE
jgi:hypothetical protein